MRAPEKVVGVFDRGGLLERGHRRSLRIQAGEQMPDHAVLAGGVERLKHDEQRLASVGVEEVLQCVYALDMLGDFRRARLMRLEVAGERRVDFRQADLAPGSTTNFRR